jgi:protocatechuate 4,5-dioxygenase beta chain
MPIGLGIASSHAPPALRAAETWDRAWQALTAGVPQPREAFAETPEVVAGYVDRVNANFAALRERLEAYRPDLLLFIGGDQSETFDSSNVPQIMILLREEAVGHAIAGRDEPTPENEVRFTIDLETSRRLLHRLVTEEDFDVAFATEQRAFGPRGRGEHVLPHAFTLVWKLLIPAMDIPVVLIYENTYDAPSLPASRCYALGQTLARLLKDDPRRIAIYGSGGLSHDPQGPRAGWIDEPMDRWFLDTVAQGRGLATTSMYTFDSATMRGGTGEVRAWITVAGAMEEMGARAEVLDYFPAHKTTTGLAWATWDASKRVMLSSSEVSVTPAGTGPSLRPG